jgi:hypothetical protein
MVQVTAEGLSDGDYVYAATDTAATRVERWEIGQSGTSWKNLEAPTNNETASGWPGCKAFGMALVDGVLYVQTTSRPTALPTLPLPTGRLIPPLVNQPMAIGPS